MHRTLIVARMDPKDADSVARLFEESDATDLPHRVGVSGRALFQFQGLYFHLIEAEGPVDARLAELRTDPLFTDLNERLKPYIGAYDPATWRSPADAMAQTFYTWSR
ncbi:MULTISPECIES: TcmI family type II polyketide cyclase [unclassified Nonomuraea]|uniref:TcmI family type II polyketide cyclase n=1 Tax=unclassified Nonomuraea TaxID=2593643 RepID=UPI0033D83363